MNCQAPMFDFPGYPLVAKRWVVVAADQRTVGVSLTANVRRAGIVGVVVTRA